MGKELTDNKERLLRGLSRQINDGRVMVAMRKVPRELFVPHHSKKLAYEDIPLPIGSGQTISQPLIVAVMTDALELQHSERVLELGTGSGYHAAILSQLVSDGKVVSVERIPVLARTARATLRSLGYDNIEALVADTTLGCPDKSPFDAIVVTAASPGLPQSLVNQLGVGGRMVIPIGNLDDQVLVKVLRTNDGISISYIGSCRFVPLIGEEAWPHIGH